MACWRQVDDIQQWAELPFLIWAGQDISEYLGAFPIPPASAGGTQALKLMEEQLHGTKVEPTVYFLGGQGCVRCWQKSFLEGAAAARAASPA